MTQLPSTFHPLAGMQGSRNGSGIYVYRQLGGCMQEFFVPGKGWVL